MANGKILVTGAGGQLGQELEKLSNGFIGYDFEFFTREDLSIDNADSVRYAFKKIKPVFCVNCAAYTAVDKAESEKDLAHAINAEAVGVLAAASKEANSKFIHISTDYVFDGTATSPYKIDAPINPQSVYGTTKAEGEKLALKNNPSSIIIRTAWVYSEFGKNFVKTMLRLMSEKESINVVNDQVGSPTYAADLAEAILHIISSNKWQPGVYHYSNTGVISWYDFAVAIKELSGSSCKVNPIPSSQYPTPAKRPAYSVLDTSLIASTFGLQLKDWKQSLQNALLKLR
jgi:dTDP-4-dehydrorhamnose reductase